MRRRWPLLLAALAASSCSPADYKIVPVSGTVKMGGKPVAGLRVGFQPFEPSKRDTSPASIGVTDKNGRYTLRVSSADLDGAAAGPHDVSFVYAWELLDAPKPADAGPPLPAKYAKKTVRYEVPADGTDSANFDLSP